MTESPIIYDFAAFQKISLLQNEIEDLRKIVEGGGGSVMSDELTDYKIAAAEARSDTKIARLEGKIDVLALSINALGAKIDSQRSEASSNRNVIISVTVGTALTIVALTYAALSYGASTFYNGTVVRDLVHSESAASASKPIAGPPFNGATPTR